MTYYKVLQNGKSFHGGTFKWSLPNGKPGKWHKHDGAIKLCRSGFHLTNDPKKWWSEDAKCFEAEFKGEPISDGDDKICVGQVRLLRELTATDLAKLQIFTEGEHEVTEGFALASGSATVSAFDSATVSAFDSATVEASGSARVEAYGSATVKASGSARVEAYDSATVHRWDGQGSTTLTGNAIEIDRRTDPPTIRGNFQTEAK